MSATDRPTTNVFTAVRMTQFAMIVSDEAKMLGRSSASGWTPRPSADRVHA